MSDQRSEKEIITEAYSDEAAKNWRAPVQGYPAGIPWALHLEAYDAYCKKWSKQTALIDMKGRHCRGGFAADELDLFVPGWRERVSYIGRLAVENKHLLAERDLLRTALQRYADKSRMGFVEPSELQQVIDDALAAAPSPETREGGTP